LLVIILSAAWAAGIFIGSKIGLPLWLCLLALIPLPLLFARRVNRKNVIVAGLGIFLLVTGAVYAHSNLYNVNENTLRYYNDTGKTELMGIVAASPEIRDKSARLTLSLTEIKVEDRWRDVEGKLLVFVPRYPEYQYGDILQIQGEIQTPPQLDDFDYKGYLEHQGIYSTAYYPQIELTDGGRGFAPLAWIYNLRNKMSGNLAEILPEPQAGLAQGILLGLRGNIPDDLNTDFARSGTSHLLAISGFNLAVMAGIMLAVGVRLFGRKRFLYVWLALGAVWFYTIITGLNPPVVRGAIMASVFLLAEFLGRQRSGAAALFLTAAIMVGINPYILGDASFQLSVTAMAGLIFINPIFSGIGRKVITEKSGEKGFFTSLINLIADSFSVTLAAIIMVWPLIAYYFGIFSLAGPLATLLLTPVQPLIMVIGMLAALVGLALTVAAQVFGWLLWPFLSYMILVVQGLGSPAISTVQITWITPLFLVIYYLALAAALLAYGRRQNIKSLISGGAGLMKTGVNLDFGLSGGAKLIVIPAVLLAVLTTFTAFTMPDDNLRVSFLDVGEGDAVLVQKGSTQVLIDGGPSPQAITLALSKQMPFWDRTIDLVILTHPHQDHLAGLVEVLRRYKVAKVMYAAVDYESPGYDEWKNIIKEKGIESVTANPGRQVTLGEGTLIEVLNPPEQYMAGTESDIDNNSVAVLIKDGEISFLLTGDTMKEAEWELIRDRADIACTVLKVAHHGSDTSSSLEFLHVANPQIAVISCGAGNKFGHPYEIIMERLGEMVGDTNIYRTDLLGTIDFTTDGERLWVKTGR